MVYYKDYMENMHVHKTSNFNLAVSATAHCLTGCGLGEVSGFFIGTVLGLSYLTSIVVGILAGFIFGYILGILPLLRANITLKHATHIVFATEFLSFVVMEIGEVLIEIFFPGMKRAGLKNLTYWIGLSVALATGFIAAFPVNFILVSRGVRHQH